MEVTGPLISASQVTVLPSSGNTLTVTSVVLPSSGASATLVPAGSNYKSIAWQNNNPVANPMWWTAGGAAVVGAGFQTAGGGGTGGFNMLDPVPNNAITAAMTGGGTITLGITT